MSNDLNRAIEVLNRGGIIIFPTDTAFGIGCRVDDKKAIERLFGIRKRPHDQAVPLLVNGVSMAKSYAFDIPHEVEDKLIGPYWPGALTVVVKCKKNKIPRLVRGGGETIGLRMPNHMITLALIRSLGVGLLGPSANFHGEDTPFDFNDLNPKLTKLVDYVLPGKCNLKGVSTVVDTTVKPWKILRQGAVSITMDT